LDRRWIDFEISLTIPVSVPTAVGS